MAKYASKKAVRHGRVTAALTVLLVATLLLLNLSVSTLAMRFGWFLNMNPDSTYPVTDACYTYLDTYVIPHAGEGIRLIFCDNEDSIRGDATQSMVLRTAEELSARYPEKVRVEYLNIWEKPSVAREYGVTASTSVIVQKGESFRVCTLRDFFLFPAGDTSSPTAYVGEKRFAVAMKAVTTADAPMRATSSISWTPSILRSPRTAPCSSPTIPTATLPRPTGYPPSPRSTSWTPIWRVAVSSCASCLPTPLRRADSPIWRATLPSGA